jgi:uridine kinase
MTIVIAISGPPGSGKSTLCKLLASYFKSSTYLSMDEYQVMTDWDPITLHRWLQQGADYNQLPMPGLAQSLQSAIRSQAQIHGDMSQKLVFLESHLGRETISLADLVNYVVWIDCDLDLCLARALLAMANDSIPYQSENISVQAITYYLQQYLSLTSHLLRLQRSRIRYSADFIYTNGDFRALTEWIRLKAA